MMDKPTEITVRHFFEHRYAQKVANRECVVRDWANGIIEDVVPLLEKGYCVKFDYRANTGYYSEGNSLLTVEWLTPVTPLPSAAGDNTRVLCDWCGQKAGVHGGECDDCWRLPGHEGEGVIDVDGVPMDAKAAAELYKFERDECRKVLQTETKEAARLQAENARLRAAVEAAGKREAGLREAIKDYTYACDFVGGSREAAMAAFNVLWEIANEQSAAANG